MDIRLEGAHEEALEQLQQHYGEKTATTVIRQLIYRDAKSLNLWPAPTATPHGNGSEPESAYVNGGNAG